MTEPTPNLPPPPKHPLQQLREILGWSREDCARETGLKASTIQNIERGAAPLPEEAAFAIEAATSSNAMELAESAEVWRRMHQEQPEIFANAGRVDAAHVMFAPKTLSGSPFTREGYDAYRKSALSPESVKNAIDDLSWRIDLLLGPLGSKPEKFRRMYRYLAQVLNRERRDSGPSEAEMAEYALQHGKSELKVMTIGELAQQPEIAQSPAWKKLQDSGKFRPDQDTHVVIDRFPFWPEIERAGSEEHYIVPDSVFGERVVWRITLPNGKPLAVTITRSQATGLQGKLTDAMIQNNRERASQQAIPAALPEAPKTSENSPGGQTASGSNSPESASTPE
jgi:transcriptional regulator with XRE-family HTH domain